MAFRFALEALLRLRRGEQRQHELELQKRSSEVDRLQMALRNILSEAAEIAAFPAQGRSAAEIQFDQERLNTLSLRRHMAEGALDRAVAARALAAAEFREAWKKRDTLETLRQHARETYAIAESRREQRSLDDWFLERKLTRK